MTNDFTTFTLSQIVTEAEAIATDAQVLFGHLNAQQLNWKPNADQWSIGQCLDHLIIINRQMFPPLDVVIKGAKTMTFYERLPVLPGVFGKIMVKAVSPASAQKLKAPSSAVPSVSAIDPQIVGQFLAHQGDVLARLNALNKFEVGKIVMTSPFMKAIIYSVLDACRIIVAHERRHFGQAQRVMATSEFPS